MVQLILLRYDVGVVKEQRAVAASLNFHLIMTVELVLLALFVKTSLGAVTSSGKRKGIMIMCLSCSRLS